MKPRVLVIDDEEVIRKRLRKLFILEGYMVYIAGSGPQGLKILRGIKDKDRGPIEVVTLDIRMPGMEGTEVLEKIKQEMPQTEVIMITGHGAVESAIQALRAGAFDYITKPIEYDQLALAITRALEKQLNITERQRAEEDLKESEEKYRELINTSIDAVIAIDPEMMVIVWNQGAARIFGYQEKEMLGQSLMKIVPERFQGKKKKGFAHFISTGSGPIIGKVTEIYGLRKDGTEFPVELSLSSRKVGDTCITTAIVRDITERKNTERALQESRTNFYNIVERSNDGIIIVDKKGITLFVNKTLESILRRKKEELLGEMFGLPMTSGEMTEIDIVRTSGGPGTGEMAVVQTEWEGEDAYLASMRDITERKWAEEAQERLSRQLQAQVSELEAFSYGIAHDLRSPLVSIEGFSRLLREDMQDQKAENVQEDIRLLESGVKRMQGFLNDTLEYSRSGQMIKRTNGIAFGEIVTEVITEFNEQISKIGLTVSIAKTFPKICIDRTRIKQVLTNLVQNSIKYRDKTIPLKIEIGHYRSRNEIVFFVRDNGPGIDASEVGKLFDLFYRGTADGEGSGIGLAVVKKIIEAHGGRIWVQQGQSGKGTTVCFTLPEQSGIKKDNNNGKD